MKPVLVDHDDGVGRRCQKSGQIVCSVGRPDLQGRVVATLSHRGGSLVRAPTEPLRSRMKRRRHRSANGCRLGDTCPVRRLLTGTPGPMGPTEQLGGRYLTKTVRRQETIPARVDSAVRVPRGPPPRRGFHRRARAAPPAWDQDRRRRSPNSKPVLKVGASSFTTTIVIAAIRARPEHNLVRCRQRRPEPHLRPSSDQNGATRVDLAITYEEPGGVAGALVGTFHRAHRRAPRRQLTQAVARALLARQVTSLRPARARCTSAIGRDRADTNWRREGDTDAIRGEMRRGDRAPAPV